MDTNKLLRDVNQITHETKRLIKSIGICESARRCDMDKGGMCRFVNNIHKKPIEKIIEIYERLR